MGNVTADEREKIIAALKSGKSQTAVAKECGRSPDTVGRIARSLDIVYTAPQKANDARVWFAKQERIALNAEMFARVRELMSGDIKPRDMKDLAIAYGILVEKRRLEEGESTAAITLEPSQVEELHRRTREWVKEHQLGSTTS